MRQTRGLLLGAAVALAMLLAAGALAGCGSDGGGDATASPVASTSSDVVAAVTSDAQLSQFAEAIGTAGVTGDGPFTVFAASNDAVTAAGVTLDGDTVKASTIEGEQLTKADVAAGAKYDSMLADNTIVTYTGSDGSQYVNTFKVVGGPIDAGNGVVYMIDGVIVPKK